MLQQHLLCVIQPQSNRNLITAWVMYAHTSPLLPCESAADSAAEAARGLDLVIARVNSAGLSLSFTACASGVTRGSAPGLDHCHPADHTAVSQYPTTCCFSVTGADTGCSLPQPLPARGLPSHPRLSQGQLDPSCKSDSFGSCNEVLQSAPGAVVLVHACCV